MSSVERTRPTDIDQGKQERWLREETIGMIEAMNDPKWLGQIAMAHLALRHAIEPPKYEGEHND